MREIKFRAIMRGTSKIIPAEHIYFHEFMDINEQFKDDEYIFMQYTGLFDKRGVEIYEGDIVKIQIWENIDEENSTGTWYNGEIKYIKDGFYIDFIAAQRIENLSYYNTRLEVIGNIYENEELLK